MPLCYCIKRGSVFQTSFFWPVCCCCCCSEHHQHPLKWHGAARHFRLPGSSLKCFFSKFAMQGDVRVMKKTCLFFLDKVSCIPDWPPTCYVAEVDLEPLILLPRPPTDPVDKWEAPCLLQCLAGNPAQGLALRQALRS